MYRLINIRNARFVRRLIDNTIIPCEPANTDYQEYLKWLEEGNTPEPADQGEQA